MPAKRRTYHHGNLREALMEAALACIGEVGLEGFSLRDVATRAGVSHQAPYRHFPDRAALVAAVAEDGFLRLTESLSRAVARADEEPEARLEALVRGYVRFAIHEEVRFRVMFSREVADKSPFPSLQEAADGALGVLVAEVETAQRDRRWAEAGPIDGAAACWALSHGLASFLVDGQLRRRGFTKASADETVTRIFRILAAGLFARA